MTITATTALDKELGHWRTANIRPQIWWRDDDAVAVTPQLKKLAKLAEDHRFPIMLAVIPLLVKPELAQYLAANPMLSAATHGYGHHNNADPERKKTELTENAKGHSVEDVVEELISARKKIEKLFGPKASEILVPPWNRISEAVLPQMSSVGFKLLSTFTDRALATSIPQINCHVDLMHWRPVKKGKTTLEVADELTNCFANRRESGVYNEPIGILSHHLVHDDAAWEATEFLMKYVSKNTIINRLTQSDLLEKTQQN